MDGHAQVPDSRFRTETVRPEGPCGPGRIPTTILDVIKTNDKLLQSATAQPSHDIMSPAAKLSNLSDLCVIYIFMDIGIALL